MESIENQSKGNPPKCIRADWSKFERRPTWSVVSSRELSVALNVSLQTICNWRLRGILPEPEPHTRSLNGNKNYYKISKIRAWLENRTEESVHWEWAKKWLPEYIDNIPNLAQVESCVKAAYKLFGVEKPLIPANFTVEMIK